MIGHFKCGQVVRKGWRVQLIANAEQIVGTPRLRSCSSRVKVLSTWIDDAIAFPSIGIMAELRMPSQVGEYNLKFEVVDNNNQIQENPLKFFITISKN